MLRWLFLSIQLLPCPVFVLLLGQGDGTLADENASYYPQRLSHPRLKRGDLHASLILPGRIPPSVNDAKFHVFVNAKAIVDIDTEKCIYVPACLV